MVACRRQLRRGPVFIAEATGVPARTVSRILARRGEPPLAACDPLTGQVIRASKATAVRYERARPGELVHLDVKKLGKIPDGGGWRTLGRPGYVTNQRKNAQIGYEYVHVAVDDHSRLAYAEICPDETGATSAAFLGRAAAYFAGRGITQIERVITTTPSPTAAAPPSPRPWPPWAPGRSSSGRTAPGRTAKPNGSTAPWPLNGPTGSPSPAAPNAPRPSPAG